MSFLIPVTFSDVGLEYTSPHTLVVQHASDPLNPKRISTRGRTNVPTNGGGKLWTRAKAMLLGSEAVWEEGKEKEERVNQALPLSQNAPSPLKEAVTMS
ncbi:hypothetical protein ONZ45_g14830 [Pleurotus djamor]|nr:hypothetical protein ONZ45_g14830 [Pleurotus djamor]